MSHASDFEGFPPARSQRAGPIQAVIRLSSSATLSQSRGLRIFGIRPFRLEPLWQPCAKTWLAFGSTLASPFGGRSSRFRIGAQYNTLVETAARLSEADGRRAEGCQSLDVRSSSCT